jgi:hypothetical protein
MTCSLNTPPGYRPDEAKTNPPKPGSGAVR